MDREIVKDQDQVMVRPVLNQLIEKPEKVMSIATWCAERQGLTISALKMVLERHQAPTIHHSAQGSQYATTAYTDLFPEGKTLISMSAVGQPTQNGLAERFMRTLKEEHVDYSDYQDCDDAERQLAHWLEVEYMSERIHSALGYLTPTEFEAMALNQPNPLLMTA